MLFIRRLIYVLMVASLTFSFSACNADVFSDEEMMQKGAFITKLTKRAQSAVYKNANDDQSMKKIILEKFPDALSEFEGYTIKMSNVSGNAVVLLCDNDAKRSLIEDISCTARIDSYFYKSEKKCEFTLDVEQFCK